jgi:DNA-binding GntR family transcriptional regulator
MLVADQLFEATAADRAITSQLGVSVGSAVFRVSSIFRTPQGMPVETRVAIYPGDRYVFHAIREFHRSAPP